ncbi:MAG: glucose-6-phosphate dehydrogenase, partial [Candidatus Entotheonellia bacterium]
NRTLREIFAEGQIYRIDHYLGKETVQNILVFRLAGGIFEPIWNRGYIDHVQITVAESLGVESRGAYYEEAGVIRDMMQNHLLQLLCLVAMEPPIGWQARSIRDEKLKVLQAICPLTPETVADCTVRGQYGPGMLDGAPVDGYRDEPGVKPDSATETFAAVKFCLETWRWADVPFYLRSGKRLPRRITEIAIQFKQPPLRLFRQVTQEPLDPSILALQIQPAEGISLTVGAKVPGPVIRIQPVTMDFRYEDTFGKETPEAYERLLLDCLQGDPTLFARGDWVEEAWALVMPILEAWENGLPPRFPNYAAGTWGPPEAEALVARDGRRWR